MARPEYIADLHEALYEVLVCAEGEVKQNSAKYWAALATAARNSGLPERDLRRSIARDFHVWMKQEGLPKPSRK